MPEPQTAPLPGRPVQAFGEWDAPVTDEAVWVDVPTDQMCMHCRERFAIGDNGAIMPTGFGQHRECALRAALGGIGHLVDHARYCRSELGPDAGLSFRDSARLVWAMHVDRQSVDIAQLEARRADR